MRKDGIVTYRDKMRQANREAAASVAALAVIAAAWLAGGIGLAGSGIEVFSTPIWIIAGTVGTWAVAVVAAVVLARRVFADFDLDSEGDAGAPGQGAPEGEATRG